VGRMSSSAPSVTDAWMLLYLDVTAVERHRHAQEQLRAFEEHGRSEAIPALTQLWGQPSWPVELRHCASAQLDAAHADAILECLPLLWRLPTLTRFDHHELVTRAKQVLGARPSSFLRRALVHEDRHVRRAMMRLLVERGQPALELATLGLDDVDPVVRLQAARLVALDASEAAAALRDRLFRDSQGRLRALGLEQQVSACSEHAAAWLERGLVDPHRSVRELARHVLGKQDPTRDFAAEHRARLAREAPTAAVAAALGETGIPSDWEHLVPALDVDDIAVVLVRIREGIARSARAATS
jgi:HEAT repeat protein